MKEESPAKVPQETPALLASLPEKAEVETKASDTRIDASPGSYSEHAPLALFSVGSLAVGGVFYAITYSAHRSNSEFTAGDRASLTNALGATGITALLAAGSYFYFAHQADDSDRNGEAQVSGGVSPEGGVSAMLTFPLSFLSR